MAHLPKKTQLRGFVCAYHPAATGSNPKHTIYTFFNLYCDCNEKKNENKQKEAGIGPFLKTMKDPSRSLGWAKAGQVELGQLCIMSVYNKSYNPL